MVWVGVWGGLFGVDGRDVVLGDGMNVGVGLGLGLGLELGLELGPRCASASRAWSHP